MHRELETKLSSGGDSSAARDNHLLGAKDEYFDKHYRDERATGLHDYRFFDSKNRKASGASNGFVNRVEKMLSSEKTRELGAGSGRRKRGESGGGGEEEAYRVRCESCRNKVKQSEAFLILAKAITHDDMKYLEAKGAARRTNRLSTLQKAGTSSERKSGGDAKSLALSTRGERGGRSKSRASHSSKKGTSDAANHSLTSARSSKRSHDKKYAKGQKSTTSSKRSSEVKAPSKMQSETRKKNIDLDKHLERYLSEVNQFLTGKKHEAVSSETLKKFEKRINNLEQLSSSGHKISSEKLGKLKRRFDRLLESEMKSAKATGASERAASAHSSKKQEKTRSLSRRRQSIDFR